MELPRVSLSQTLLISWGLRSQPRDVELEIAALPGVKTLETPSQRGF